MEEESESILIVDDHFSCQPTYDREQLLKIINHLASKVFDALVVDERANQRAARGLAISNRLAYQLRGDDGHGDLALVDMPDARTEVIHVKLPYTVDTWNDLEESDIAFEMCKAVVDIHEEYVWFEVKATVHQFISDTTRRLIEVLDVRETDPQAALEMERDIHLNTPDLSTSEPDEDDASSESELDRDDDDDGVATIEIDVPNQVKQEPTRSQKPPVVINELSDDDDDSCDIMIVEEIRAPAASKPKAPAANKATGPAPNRTRTPPTPNTAKLEQISKRLKMLNTRQSR